MTHRILDGVRVLDITQIVAGPVCTRMLADLGADVVKIDSPSRAPGEKQPRRSAGPAAQNAGKRSIVIDLRKPAGLAIARKFAETADVVVQNYRPGALAALGLGYEALRELNPRLIYATISGFGEDTSYASRGAYGATAHAEAGWLWVQQQAQGGDEPFAPGVTVADIATGMNACTAIVAALYDREKTGAGQSINVTLMDSQLAFLAEAAVPALTAPADAPWIPFRHGLQRARDGYVAINVGSPRNWQRLAKAMGSADGASLQDQKAAERMLEDWVAGRTVEEVASALGSAGAPYGAVYSMHEALEHPYFAEREMIASIPDPLDGTVRVVGSPLRFSGASSAPAGGAPLAGQHTEAILRELGYDQAAVKRFIESGAVESAAGHQPAPPDA